MDFHENRLANRLQHRLCFWFAVIEFNDGFARFWFAVSATRALDLHGPVLLLTNRQWFYLSGALALVLSGFMLWTSSGTTLKLGLIAWFSSGTLVYRWLSFITDAPDWSSCLGNLSERLPIHPQVLDEFRLAFFAGTLLTSCGFLVFAWLRHRRRFAKLELHLGSTEAENAAGS